LRDVANQGAKTKADLLIIGGGINGAGIARDAAGRGLSVVLVEQADLASATSSASSKLIHGGLRYLEQLEFRLVAEALREREVLLHAAPHLVQPLRFIMPHAPGLRPGWMIRAGLVMYDYLARRQMLPGSSSVNLTRAPFGAALQDQYVRGYAYWDCRVDDSRLVVANALAAAERGARILPRTRCVSAAREGRVWRARLRDATGESEVTARALVNAAGPWADQVAQLALSDSTGARLQLVQGSHIVVPRIYEGDHAFILQNDDRRVVFVCPYEDAYTLIGTTDVEVKGGPGECVVTPQEIAYLCRAANRYFQVPLKASDVVWQYCGVRALVDERDASPSALSRDYRLQVDGAAGEAPLISVFGGKITTYRRLAERVLDQLVPWFSGLPCAWTANVSLPGGDLPAGGVGAHTKELRVRYPGLSEKLLGALAGRHGSRAAAVLGTARSTHDLGEYFGGELYAREVDYFMHHEWAHEAADVLWRRTKTGLHLQEEDRARVAAHMKACAADAMR
jgi:D-erythritol 1-phosphate dehydrogenase